MKPTLGACALLALVFLAQFESGPAAAITTPLLVVTSAASPFSSYYPEILRAEGLNAFATVDISAVTAATLAPAGVAVLAETPLTAAQVQMFTDWVNGGGKLVVMRPDKKLAQLVGLVDTGATLADAYLRIDTTSVAGAGLVADTIQFHGTSDVYVLAAASIVATLYTNAATATSNPAVTSRGVGVNGGAVETFTFDLARSVVYTRQGNPAWNGQERDGFPPIRSDDLFFGAAVNDQRPDWVDLTKIAIPQADELQRLFGHLVEKFSADRTPLPRFWYFPNGYKAVVIMTGDDHGRGGTVGRFNGYIAASPAGCSVADWQCIRSTSYVYPGVAFTNTQAAAFVAQGFEIALHPTTLCADWTPASLESFFVDQLANWHAQFPSVPGPATNRTHCIAWSDYDTEPQVELNHGMRLDTSYYFWPPGWVADRPGFFTGSGMPMRFSRATGGMIDVYQATTQMTDESAQTYPFTIDTLLNRALGAEGYYGAFTANMHTDDPASPGSDAIIASTQAHGVPVVSSLQMLQWLDGRNASTLTGITWDPVAGTLTFTVAPGAGARGLLALVPATLSSGALTGVTRNGVPVAFNPATIKGISYGSLAATAGTYRATYSGGGPVPPNTTITAGPAGLTNSTAATFTFTSTQPGSTFTCSLDAAAFASCSSPTAFTALANGAHNFQAAATNAGLTDPTPAAFSWTIDATPPTVSITAPLTGATVSGTTTVTAGAADNVGVVGVQVRLDGVNLGAEVPAAPFTISWNTTTTTNASHALTAIARDGAGNLTTSAAVIVAVNNALPPPAPPPPPPPPATDTVTVTRADYTAAQSQLRIEATSTNATATLTAFVTATGATIGTFPKAGGGRLLLTWPVNPQSVTVKSSLGGTGTRTVTLK
jgi:hypothetical protein